MTFVACGARTGLVAGTTGVDAGGGGAPFVDSGAGAGPVDASDASLDASDASLDASDASNDASDATAEASDAALEGDLCASEPCLCAPELLPGPGVSGSTCTAVNPPGSSCSAVPTVFFRFTVPPATEIPLLLSGHLAWGVLCACPESPGAGCCVGPGGTTGNGLVSTVLANKGSTPLHGALEIQRADGPCGAYSLMLGP